MQIEPGHDTKISAQAIAERTLPDGILQIPQFPAVVVRPARQQNHAARMTPHRGTPGHPRCDCLGSGSCLGRIEAEQSPQPTRSAGWAAGESEFDIVADLGAAQAPGDVEAIEGVAVDQQIPAWRDVCR